MVFFVCMFSFVDVWLSLKYVPVDLFVSIHSFLYFRLHLPGKLKEENGEESGSYDISEGSLQ